MSAAGTEILRAEGICKSYDGRAIIRDVSLRLDQGELVCLLGVSGAGKTTLFHALSGLERPEAGRVLLSGEDITGRPGKISYMLQKDLVFLSATAAPAAGFSSLPSASSPPQQRGCPGLEANSQPCPSAPAGTGF